MNVRKERTNAPAETFVASMCLADIIASAKRDMLETRGVAAKVSHVMSPIVKHQDRKVSNRKVSCSQVDAFDMQREGNLQGLP
jgi:hypothetical protein